MLFHLEICIGIMRKRMLYVSMVKINVTAIYFSTVLSENTLLNFLMNLYVVFSRKQDREDSSVGDKVMFTKYVNDLEIWSTMKLINVWKSESRYRVIRFL